MPTAIYAGSFDPVHLGHLSVISSASERFEVLFVVVASNPLERTGLFDGAQRVDLLVQATRHLPNVQVVAHYGLLVDIADRLEADVLVRSAGKEHTDEIGMAYMNEHASGIPTALLLCDPATAYISSTRARALIAGGNLEALRYLVPDSVVQAVAQNPSRCTLEARPVT